MRNFTAKNVTKRVNGLSKAEYAQLLTKVAEYRKENIAEMTRTASQGKYGRIFTEPRKNGVRSKYWYVGQDCIEHVMRAVSRNPILNVNGTHYAVTCKVFKGKNRSYYSSPSSVSLHFTTI